MACPIALVVALVTVPLLSINFLEAHAIGRITLTLLSSFFHVLLEASYSVCNSRRLSHSPVEVWEELHHSLIQAKQIGFDN